MTSNPLSSIEIEICGQSYELKSQENEEHLREVAELVRRKVENLRKQNPSLTLHRATMMAALDFASSSIKGRKKATLHRNHVLNKANQLLDKIQTDLESAHY